MGESQKSDQEKKDQSAIYTVFLRNRFYQDGYFRMLFILLLTIGLAVLLGIAVIYRLAHPPKPLYFPTTPDGRIIQTFPLSKPVVSDDFVLQWATDSVSKAFALDFVHWRHQLSSAEENFTPFGWKGFVKSLKESNNLNTLMDKQLVSNLKITGSPRVARRALIKGRYAWRILVPAMLQFKGAHFNLQMPMNIALIIVRVPVKNYPQRIAINNFISQTLGPNEASKQEEAR